jgi:hypothetical protein
MELLKKTVRNRKVTVNLQGGIGNQLFSIFAAYYVASKHKANLILDKSLASKAKTCHPDCLESLAITFGDRQLSYTVNEFRKPATLLLLERLGYKLLHNFRRAGLLLNQHRSKVFGFDPMILTLLPPVQITGYFQTYKYIEDISSELGNMNICLSNASSWFQNLSIQIANSGSTVAIHVRRGDYLDHKFTLGMLQDEYFLSALLYLKESYKIDWVFIFSDSTQAAEELKGKIEDVNCVVVVPPEESPPTESMLLMSQCGFRIISNSTFSWWAGYLGTEQTKVVAPYPWYRNHIEPDFLIPAKWIRMDSKWSD